MARYSTSAQRALLLALASAGLLIVAFPSFNQPWAAWVALVPWLVLLRRTHARAAAFLWSFLIGILFFLGSMWWLIHVTLIGWLVLTGTFRGQDTRLSLAWLSMRG